MSPYILVYLIVFFQALFVVVINKRVYATVRENYRRNLDDIVSSITTIMLGAMLAFRYGQGTDYFNYYRNFDLINPNSMYNLGLHTEIGWKFLNFLIKSNNLPFEFLVFIISVFEIFCIKKFLNIYCKNNKTIALIILYPAVIFVYLISALRQGLVISVFLGIMLPMLDSGEYKKYAVMTLVMTAIHTVAIVYLLILPILKNENNVKLRHLERIKILSVLLALYFGIMSPERLLKNFIPPIVMRHAGIEFSYPAVIENLVIMLLMTQLYYNASNKEEIRRYYIIFSIGVIFFFLTSWMTLFANRTFSCWKYVYIVFFIKYFIANRGIRKQIALLFFICFSSFMLIRNIDAAIEQGSYVKSVNAFNYPYMSIFDKSVAQKMRSDYR